MDLLIDWDKSFATRVSFFGERHALAGRDPLFDRELLALADRCEQEADARLEYLQQQPKGSPAARPSLARRAKVSPE